MSPWVTTASPAGTATRLEAAGELLDGGQRQGVEHRHPLEQPDVHVEDVDGPVQAPQSPPATATARTGHTSPIAISAAATPNQLDHRRGEDRPQPDRHRDEALQHAEDARQHRVGSQPADEGEPGDVDQRVADADEGEQEQRRRLLREDADERDGQSPQRDPDREPDAQPAGADQQRRAERAEHRADADGRHERADARVAGAEQLDRDHDGEHGQRAAGQRLRCGQAEDELQITTLRDRSDALDRLLEQVGATRRRGARRGVVPDPQQQERPPRTRPRPRPRTRRTRR